MASLPEDDDFIQATKELMRADAVIIPAKIAGAEGGDLYSIRIQNAAIIRYHNMNLYVQVGSLRFHESYKDLEYVQLIRKEIGEFRLLFIDWVNSVFTLTIISGMSGVYSIRQLTSLLLILMILMKIISISTTFLMRMTNKNELYLLTLIFTP